MKLGVGVVVLGLAAAAHAREYGVQILVDSEEDLYDLQATGELDDSELELLVALLHRPIDINRADRVVLYELPEVTYALADAIVAERARQGGYKLVEDLLQVPGITPDVFVGMEPFITVAFEGEAAADALPARGRAAAGVLFEDVLYDNAGPSGWVRPGNLPNAYLLASASDIASLNAGLLVTYRPLLDVQWDYAQGALVSSEPKDQLSLDGLFVSGRYRGWYGVLGTYNVGFGERLTIDTTVHEQPTGIDERLTAYVRREDGAVRPRDNLLGAAVSLQGAHLPVGWLDATAFASYQRNDLYQYDLWYGFDAGYAGSDRCDSDSDCPDGYTCRADLRCASSRIYDAGDPATSYTYQTIDDAFSELLVGGDATVSFDERTSIGATAYHSTVNFLAAETAEPRFALSAAYPQADDFGAVGAHGALGLGSVDLAAETTWTLTGKPAAIARAVVAPARWAELQLQGYYYHRDFENPHSRALAPRTETMGLTRRNKEGGRLQLVLRPWPRSTFTTFIEAWQEPYSVTVNAGGDLGWQHDPVVFGRAVQRARYAVSRKEDISLQCELRNNDLERNGPEEPYVDDDVNEYGFRAPSTGEKIPVRLEVITQRIPRTRVAASYTAAWEGASKRAFGFENYARLSVTTRAWPGSRLQAALRYWLSEQVTRDDVDFTATLGVRQQFHRQFAALISMGVAGERDERPDDFGYFMAGKLETRF